MATFEWDEQKRKLNLAKHEIDFVDAVNIFFDSNRIELETIRQGEIRYQMNAKLISMHNKGKTKWKKLKSMTERQIRQAAKSDPDAPLLTAVQLKKFKRVKAVQKIDVKAIRIRLHLSQDAFAHYFGVSSRTIQEWEQHRREPTATARNFLKVIEKEPKAVLRALTE
jgi:DNA-binding transcriptional regulator YiaG